MAIGLMSVVFLAVLFITRAPSFGIAVAVAASILAVTVAYAISLIWRGTWECRVEGMALSFHRPQDRGWVVMQISDIEQITDLRPGNYDGRTDLELLLRNGSRVLLDRRLIGNEKRFRQAIKEAKPLIRFDRRDWRECHACSSEIRGLRDRCPKCNAPVAVPIPPQSS